MGSIPPAASIEHPQREIVNFISRSGMTPDSADLLQLARCVQADTVNYAVDAGTASAYAVTLNPPPLAYYPGLPIRMKVSNTPTGASTLNVNSLGPKPIKKRNGAAIQAFDFFAGDVVLMIYDGVSFQLVGAQPTPLLAAPMIYYVATTGSDSNDGLTASTPFLTIQHACNVISGFNLNGYNVTVYVANGTYGPVDLPIVNGSGRVVIIGNSSSPASCTISAASTFGGFAVLCNGPGYLLEGFSVTTPGPKPGIPGAGIWVVAGAVLTVNNINFGPCGNSATSQSWWVANDGGYIVLNGAISISGGSSFGFGTINNGQIRTGFPNKPTLTITAPVTVTYFGYATNAGLTDQEWGTMTGAVNVTGTRYFVAANGIIDTGGAGASYLPGTIAGITQTGGQYV